MNRDIKQEPGDYIEYLSKRSRPDPMANAMVYTIWNTKVGLLQDHLFGKNKKISINRITVVTPTDFNYFKGGVGKSTLTFHCSSQYAKTHPDRRVLVIDMCPQANVSTALLGSSRNPNSSILESIRNDLVEEESDQSEEENLSYFKSM